VRIRTVFSKLSHWLTTLAGVGRHLARGRRAEAQGRLADACRHYRAAVAADPFSADAHLHLGVALEAAGDLAGAIVAYEAALVAQPRNAYAAYNLGKTHFVRGDLARAEASLRSALTDKAEFPEALVVLSGVLEARGDAAGAMNALEAAIALRPGYGGALRNVGLLHARMQKWDEAASALSRASVADPADADVHYWLGNALVRLGRPGEAAAAYHGVLQRNPDHAEAHCRLANLLAELGRREESLAHVQRALSLAPRLVDAHVALGNLHAAEQRFAEAAGCYRAAIELDERHVQARVNLGNALVYLGDAAGARQTYDAAIAIDPESAAARWARTMARIPAIRETDTDLGETRRGFAEDLAELDRWFDAGRSAVGHEVVGVQQPFWLAYQAQDNLELMRAYGGLCVRLMGEWQARAGLARSGARKPGPIRIGVVSQYFRRHSVWDALVKGWFQELDHRRFELYAFNLGKLEDDDTRLAEARAARFVRGPRDLRRWAEAILDAQPDVLIYPEVGMDPITVKLASLRLAGMQAASWGHPETTGLPTIDCYLSASGLEPDGAQAHYAERLITLPGLGCYLEPGDVPRANLEPDRWGLPADARLLLCPGTPFKYAPEHDALYAEIARRLDRAHLCFFVCGIPQLSERLRLRLARAFAKHGVDFDRRVSFVPWLPKAEFYSLMQRADAMLDTIGFSGFNTAMQAVECALPLVTCEGEFLRGRLASGILKRIGLDELVAGDGAQYVDLAVRLVEDREYRERLRGRMAAGRSALYLDRAPIRALEAFLQSAIGR
jgi:protein O-GlcNAc transferase